MNRKLVIGLGLIGAGLALTFFARKAVKEMDSALDIDYSDFHLWVWN